MVSVAADLVVFDYDGTVCDSAGVKTRAFRDLYLDDHGPGFADAVCAYHLEHAGESRYDKIRYVEESMLGRPHDPSRIEARAAQFANLVRAEVIASPLMPGISRFLKTQHNQVPMAVASATPTPELVSIVRAHGLSPYFFAVKGSPEPKAGLLSEFIERLGVRAQRTVMIGDQPSDLEAAVVAGTAFVGYQAQNAAPVFGEATRVISDFDDLPAAIDTTLGNYAPR
jgi:phosphoglycolate phosphatase-like HAD superfamily hydrolase